MDLTQEKASAAEPSPAAAQGGFTQEAIDSLGVNEVAIMKEIADELGIRIAQVSAVISLVNEGCTIPFIARYRKERHGSLDEVQVRQCDRLFTSKKNLEERRLEIVRGIFSAGRLTDALYRAVTGAKTLAELEDLWLPFKKKRKTRGMAASERGLEPLADDMEALGDAALEERAAAFIKTDCEDAALNVESAEAALAGAADIVAERVAQSAENRACVKRLYLSEGKVRTKGIVPEGQDAEAAENSSIYRMYWDYSEPLSRIKPHRVLAISRAEREGALDVTLDVDVKGAVCAVQARYSAPSAAFARAAEDGVVRLLSPAVVREIRSELLDAADGHAIGVFSENLWNLLMTRPIKGSRVLGVDPGIRTGTKCAALDETGKFLGYFLIKQTADPEGAFAALSRAIEKYAIQVVAVGNGTGSQEVQAVVSRVISERHPEVAFTVVDESGASVYSASDVAREEFPTLDLTIRGAISMGRRLQDPLSELVKIDPKSIGVGLYQHDVNQKKLSEALDDVVSSVVNRVGVNLNTASASLLKYVSGINSPLAKRIVSFRDENGAIRSREALKGIDGLGPKTFEQCAGFLKIPESENPLDNTWVHPENYDVARELLPLVRQGGAIPTDVRQKLEREHGIGDETINDIASELLKPSRDPRDDYPAPIMQKGALKFEDLKVGMRVQGKVQNVVDFGAFVDLGLHESALIHISEMSDSFVKNASDVLKVGDVREFTVIDLDAARRRISLSLKSGGSAPRKPGAGRETHSADGAGHKKRVVVVKKGGAKSAQSRSSKDRESGGSDDGMYYNPFASLLKK